MKRYKCIHYYFFLFIFFCLLFYYHHCYAWQQGIYIGYGHGKEIEQNYYNQGLVISGKLYKLRNIDDKLTPSIDATLTSIHSAAPQHKTLKTAAIALALRAYFQRPTEHRLRPYFQLSFGPAYLSSKTLGTRTQGSHFAFQSTIETGSEIEINDPSQAIDINLRFIHYCNAGLFSPNQGIDLSIVFNVGYLF